MNVALYGKRLFTHNQPQDLEMERLSWVGPYYNPKCPLSGRQSKLWHRIGYSATIEAP